MMLFGLGRLFGIVLVSKGFVEELEGIVRGYWRGINRFVVLNGSLMRMYVLGLVMVWEEEIKCFELGVEILRLMYVDFRCVVVCVVGSGLVRELIRGEVMRGEDIDGVIERGRRWYESVVGRWEEDLGVDWEELWRVCDGKDGLEGLRLDDGVLIGFVYKMLGVGVVLFRMVMDRNCGVFD